MKVTLVDAQGDSEDITLPDCAPTPLVILWYGKCFQIGEDAHTYLAIPFMYKTNIMDRAKLIDENGKSVNYD